MITFIFVILMASSVTMDSPAITESKDATIIRYDSYKSISGYYFFYETSDGTLREEKAEIRNPGTKDETLVVRGTISWLDSSTRYNLTYVADENGYQPLADHLPKSVT